MRQLRAAQNPRRRSRFTLHGPAHPNSGTPYVQGIRLNAAPSIALKRIIFVCGNSAAVA